MIFAKLRWLTLVVVASFAVACVVESDPEPSPRSGDGGGGAAGTGTPGGTNGSGTSSNASPILVDVDADKTMNARPGEGVGVFVEYASGGHWHVWWTCDTNVNPQGALTCDFVVSASVTQGAITLVKAEAGSGATNSMSKQELHASTVTGAELHGLYFDTDPGATITLEATIGGVRDGRYFFFVQDGKVNGGFTGTLSDPLMLEGTKA